MALPEAIEKVKAFLREPLDKGKRVFLITETQAGIIRGFGRFDSALLAEIAADTLMVPSQVNDEANKLGLMGLMSTRLDQDLKVLDLTGDGKLVRSAIQNPLALARSHRVFITEDPKPTATK